MAFGGGGSWRFGHPGRVISHAQAEVFQALTEPSLADAARSLERYHALAGTYADADVGGGLQLRLRWASATAYCLESVGAGGVQHLLGPGGSPAPGPCF
jgi:hypothetical protein